MTFGADILHGLELDALSFDPADLEGLTLDEAVDYLIAQEMEANERLDQLARTLPLAVVPLWVRSQEHIDSLPEWAREGMPDDGPDQRSLFIAMLTHSRTVAGGGNRAGKTWAMYCALLCFMLGRDHPMVAAFLELNDVDPELVPLGPGVVYLVAPSSSHSIKTHRTIVERLLPTDSRKWYGKESPGEAFVQVDCPGYATPARCYFMSMDQSPDKFRGIEGRFVGIDEEPKDKEGKLIFDECCRAVSGEAGKVVIAATAQDGETWMVVMMRDTDRCFAARLDSLCNYLVNDFQGLLNWFNGMPAEAMQVRRYGEPAAGEGAIYPEFNIGDRKRMGRGHVCEPFGIPADWPRFFGADYGVKNPTAVVWGAIGDDGTVYIYREHVQSGRTWEDQAVMLHEAMGHELVDGVWEDADGDVLELGWGDPAEPKGIRAWTLADLPVTKADNAVRAGINTVRDFLRVQLDERPRLKVFSTCPQTIQDLQRYQWNERMKGQHPLKKDDHLADAVRYLLRGVASWLGA